jgi:hypothetical protein
MHPEKMKKTKIKVESIKKDVQKFINRFFLVDCLAFSSSSMTNQCPTIACSIALLEL